MKKSVSKELAALRHEVHIKGEIDTMKTLITRAGEAYGDRKAIVEKKKDKISEYTMADFYGSVNALGTALLDMGLKGKHIAILGEGSFNWIVSFFGVCCGVGISVPLDKELTDYEIGQLISKADCDAVFCSKTYIKAVKMQMEKDDRIKYAFLMSGKCDDERFYQMSDLIAKGKELIAGGDRAFLDAKIDKDDICAIIFTSGTTGANKGVMLTHYNLGSNVDGVVNSIEQEGTSFSILPMNHVYELSGNIMTAIYMNAVIYINDSLRNIMANIQLFKPDAMATVPLVLEGIYNGIWEAAKKQGKDKILKKLVKFSDTLLSHGIDMRKVLFKSIRKNFGDTLPTLVCGGAPSRYEHLTGLYSFGFAIYNGYGLTESSPTVTLNRNAGIYPESAGVAFPKMEFIIHDPNADGIGEIWIRGDSVCKGYYKDEEATKASFEDGWFKTGDYGRTNENKELFIVGRKKNLIILDNGKNVFPEDIESSVMEGIKYIREVVAFEAVKNIRGQERKIISIGVYVEKSDFPGMTEEEIRTQILNDVSAVSRNMSSYKKVQDVYISFEEFAKTSTRKVIRQKVVDQYYVSLK